MNSMWLFCGTLMLAAIRSSCVFLKAEFIGRVECDGLADEWVTSSWGLLYLAGELDADYRRPVPGTRPSGRIRPGWYAGFG